MDACGTFINLPPGWMPGLVTCDPDEVCCDRIEYETATNSLTYMEWSVMNCTSTLLVAAPSLHFEIQARPLAL